VHIDDPLGRALLALARNAIGERFGLVPAPVEALPELATPGATFVTLTESGELRGCIGSLRAERPLGEDVQANAQAAAFADPRFPPLARHEFGHVRIEVSLLGEAEFMNFADEADALAQLRPHVDGVILFHGCRRATFLPQVWESLPDPARFLAQLKMKAGLSPALWDDRIMLARYEVRKWQET
jgi:AmmeMemoRadiSam system protein A